MIDWGGWPIRLRVGRLHCRTVRPCRGIWEATLWVRAWCLDLRARRGLCFGDHDWGPPDVDADVPIDTSPSTSA